MKQLTLGSIGGPRKPRWTAPKGVAVGEIEARTMLCKTGIPDADYCLNPYVGCLHACRYCYAAFMKRFSGHTEDWGTFVDAKVNAAAALGRQLRRSGGGSVIVGSVTDAYQPPEAAYRLTRQCVELLSKGSFDIQILTKSPLVLRDLDVLLRCRNVEVGVTVTTDDERMRQVFEPGAPSIASRVRTLKRLHEAGIRTFAFVGPVLPMDPRALSARIGPYVNRVLIDQMNYVGRTRALYRKLRIEEWLDRDFLAPVIETLRAGFGGRRTRLC